jgi:osomolarity two-component system sensor histidine kinase SLN1
MDKDKQDMVSSVTNDFQLMSRVLNDVLSLDRIALGMLEPSIEPFKFDQTVEQAVNGFRSQAQALKLDLKLEADPKIEELVLLGDSGRLRQLIENLTSNSFKFTREGSVTIVTKLLGIVGGLMTPDRMADDLKLPTIKDDCEADQITVLPIRPAELRASTSSDYRKYSTTSILSSNAQSRSNSARGGPRRAIIRVEVRDTGVGFGPDDVKETELFSEYRQTKVGKKQGGSGSGLGLALCRKFIEVFGGRLGVESEAGQGSTFW